MINHIKHQLQRVKACGADYADARYFPVEETEHIAYVQGNLKTCYRARTTGVGVRVLYKGAWGFAAASTLDSLPALFDRALDNAKVAAQRVTFPARLAAQQPVKASYESPCAVDPFEASTAEKIAFLKRIDGKLEDKTVAQRFTHLDFMKRQMLFFNTEGAEIEKKIHEVFASMKVVGIEKDGLSQERSHDLCGSGQGTRGWESLQTAALFEDHAPRIIGELARLLAAPACPQDKRSVILLPGIMFLQTHEVIGHPLELDRILGYELSYAGGSFVRLEDFGSLQYGSEKLTVRADATLPNSPGSFGYDDDGTPCRNTVLIDKGILKNAITSRHTIVEANTKAGREIFTEPGGCARASGFNRVPLERMTNINIDPGDDGLLDDIVKKTERGIILDGTRSWSIGSNREQFHFACEIGWLVEDGAVKGVVKNPTYGSATLPFWRSLSAVGSDDTCELAYVPNCGKGQPNQTMELGHRVPVCRFDNVQIGK
ncbi:TldD/PmbA family protein [bacterium]|nr:TldD/PmbA family protein [bacterium]